MKSIDIPSTPDQTESEREVELGDIRASVIGGAALRYALDPRLDAKDNRE